MIHPVGPAGGVRGGIEVGIVQGLPTGAVHQGPGHEELNLVFVVVPQGEATLVIPGTPTFEGGLAGMEGLWIPCDDVDHPEKGTAAVHGGPGPADNLHPLDEVNVHDRAALDERAFGQAVVDALAVHEEEQPRVVVTRPAEPTGAEVGVVPVVGNVEPADAPEDVGQRLVSETPDLFPVHDGHGSRGVRGELGAFGSGSDALDLHLKEVLEAELGQVGGIRVGRSNGDGKTGRTNDGTTGPPSRPLGVGWGGSEHGSRFLFRGD